MLSKARHIISSPADLIAVYLFTVYHYVRLNSGWPARKFYLTVIFLLAAVWEVIRLIRSHQLPHLRLDAMSCITLLLGVSIVLPAVFSKYGYLAYDPKHLEEGAVIWCVYLAIFLLFRKEYVPKKAHLLMLLISGYIECLLVIIHSCVYNIYGANASCYGNPNLLGLGMSIVYALNLLMLADEQDRTMCLIHYILAFFFSIGMILSRSDNTLLCIAALLGILPFLRRITADLLKKLLRLVSVLLLSMAVVHLLVLLPSFQGNKTGCVLLALSWRFSPLLTTAAGLLIFVFQMLISEGNHLLRLTQILRVCVIVLMILVMICLLLANFAGVSFGVADKIFRINDAWGTGRGRIWRVCLFAFREFATPLQKLFGTGINSTPYFTYDFIPKIVNTMKAYYCTPHNFLLQWLMEGGVIGLVLFCGFCFMALRNGLKRNECCQMLAAGVVTVILAGWLVTVHSPDITPYFIVFLAICAAPEKSGEIEKTTCN